MANYNTMELMIVAASRALDDGRTVGVGTGVTVADKVAEGVAVGGGVAGGMGEGVSRGGCALVGGRGIKRDAIDAGCQENGDVGVGWRVPVGRRRDGHISQRRAVERQPDRPA